MNIIADMDAAGVEEKKRLASFGKEHRSWKERVDSHEGPPDFVIDGYIPKGILTTFYGQDGLGKSTLTMVLAIQVAVGRETLFTAAKPPQRVLYISSEDPERAVVDRFKRITGMLKLTEEEFEQLERNFEMPDMIGEDITVMRFGYDGERRLLPFAAQLEARLETDDLDWVILDPISDLFADNESDFTKVAAMLRHLNALASKYDTAVMLIGHPAKDENSTYGGSRAWSSKSRSRLLLRKKDSKPFPVFSQEKSSYGPKSSDVTCLWDTDWGVLAPTENVLADVARKSALEPVIADILDGIEALAKLGLYGKNTPASRHAYLPKALHGEKLCSEHSQEDLSEATNILIQRGILVPNWEFKGQEGSPTLRDGSRHNKVGVWFKGGSRAAAEASSQQKTSKTAAG